MKNLRIVIPTKNEEKYLPILLKSISKQSYKDYEIVVSDANSTDRTRKIARTHKCKVVKGGYLDIGRNNGAKGCAVPMLCFIDSDVVLPIDNLDFLKNSLDEFKRKKLDLAATMLKPVRARSQIKNFFYTIFYEVSNIGIKLSKNSKSPFMQSLIIMKTKVHKKVGGFPPYEFGEDSGFAKIAVSKYGFKFGVLNKSGYAYISPRRIEKEGIVKMVCKSIYFNVSRIIGHEFERGKTKSRYW